MEWKRASNRRGHWKATQVWLMVSFAFLYPYETFFLTLPGWVLKFSRETSGLKYTAETGKGHCLCPHTINVNVWWVWLTPCKPPPLLLSSWRHRSGRCRQTETIVMPESHQVWTEPGQRPLNSFHLYFMPSSEHYRYSLTDVYAIPFTGLSRSVWFIFCMLYTA